jgi:hypothetical protein
MRTTFATRRRDERGMTTAEYAVGTVASCGFAGLLITLLKSDWASGLLKQVIDSAIAWLL